MNDQLAATLRKFDLAATSDEDHNLVIEDEDGRTLFRVTPKIDWRDLHQLLLYAERERTRGIRLGEESARLQMRAALGIAEAIDTRLIERRLVKEGEI